MEEISISEPVRRQLRSYLLEQRDLIDSVRKEHHTAIAGQPGNYRCLCTVAVRRPLDPETAELRQLDVTLRRVEKGWVISAVDGLSGAIEGEGGGADADS